MMIRPRIKASVPIGRARSRAVVHVLTAMLAAFACAGPGLRAQAVEPPESKSVIDVAVFWTPTAGAHLRGPAATRAEIDRMIAGTNQAYEDSGVHQRLSLVLAQQVEFEETDPDLIRPRARAEALILPQTMRWLTSPDDGRLDDIHDLRDEFGADICVLLIGNLPYAGTAAAVEAGASSAFALVGAGTGIAGFARQLGHLQGLRGDRYSECSPDGVCPSGATAYGYGYVNQRAFETDARESSRWLTIMATDAQCTANGVDCRRLLRFSNPDQVYPDPGGDALGVAGRANAVRRLNERRKAVESFRLGPAGPTLSVAPAITPVTEGTAAVFTVTLDKTAPYTLDVPVEVKGVGASLLGTPPTSLVIPPGITRATLKVPTDQDAVASKSGTVTVILKDGWGYTPGELASASVTVYDQGPVVGAGSLAAPGQVAVPQVQESGLHALTVSWSEPDTATVVGTAYDLQYRKAGAEDWSDGPQNRSGTTAEILGLDGDTNYQVRVRARNAALAGPWSEPAEGTTALLLGTLTVGALSPEARGFWGYQRTLNSSSNSFGQLTPASFTYHGVEYRIRILAMFQGRRALGSAYHSRAIDIYLLDHPLPDGWVLRIDRTRLPVSEGYRLDLGRVGKKVIWPDPGVSLSLGQTYTVALSREPSAEKDEEFDPGTPLTVEMSDLPRMHNGTAPFTFRLRFSEDIDIQSEAFQNGVFELSGGTVTAASQTSWLSNQGWEITVQPTGPGPASVAIPGNRACGTPGAICTATGKKLAARAMATVPGPAVSAQPVATIAAVAGSVTEGSPASFTVTLSTAAPTDLTVPVSVTGGGSFLAGTPPASVAFASGETTATLSVPTDGDSVVEADSTVTATVAGSAASASVTVLDDDTAAFTVSADPASVIEGETATLTVAISNGVTFATDQLIPLAVSGSASLADYADVPHVLTLPAGASLVEFSLQTTVDHIEEETETVTVTASRAGSPIGSATVSVVSYSHDATLSALSLSGIDIGPFSSGTLSYRASVEQSVDATTVTATASHPRATVSIEPGPDVSLAEGANGIAVTVTAEDGKTTATYVVAVTRHGPPEASIAAGSGSVPEGTPASFTVSLIRAARETVNVSLLVSETGSLLAGSPPASVAIPAGSTSASLSLPTDQNDIAERDSKVTVVISAGEGYVVSEASSARITVEDDESRRAPSEGPAKMDAPTVYDAGLNALTVTWAEPEPFDPRITAYDLQYRKSEEANWTDGPENQTRLRALIEGLEIDTNYQVRIRARNVAFHGEWSEPTECVTAFWVSTLTVGAMGAPGSTTRLQYQGFQGLRILFGEMTGWTPIYDGVEYPIETLAQFRGRRAGLGGSHGSALDLHTTVQAMPDNWILRVDETRFATNDAVRITLAKGSPQATEKLIWIEPDISFAIGDRYEVALSRQPSAKKARNVGSGLPLSVAFDNLPETHDGATPFTVGVRFSEEVSLDHRDFGDGVLAVTAGTVQGARQRTQGSNLAWDITVQPAGNGTVQIAMSGDRNCDLPGAVCTAAGKKLSNSVEVRVLGPAALQLPTATITSRASPVIEGMPAEFTVTLDRAATEPLTVSVSTTESGAALSGTAPGSVTIAQGQTSATLSLPTAADSVVKADSLVTVAISAGAGYLVGLPSSASVEVEDDDAPIFTVSADPQEIAEGETAVLTVAIADGVSFAEDQIIGLGVSGTASRPDYSGVPPWLTLAAGTSSVSVIVAASPDQEEEDAETLTVTAYLGDTAVGAIGSATVTITSVSQDATLSALSLSRVDIGTFSGGVTDYSASVAGSVSSTTVTATASHPGATVSIDPGPEASLDVGANEIVITVTAEDGATSKTYTVTVTRAGLPVATIAAGATTVTEGTPASFTLSLDAAAPEALTVAVNVAESGSVLSGTPPSSVAFAKGATSATLSVPTSGDNVVEADGTVTATLVTGSGYSLGTDVLATVAVKDDDTATFTVSAEPQTIAEGESATLTVAITNGVSFAVDQSVSLAVSGTASASDYTLVPTELTLAAGASSATAELTASEDREEEEAETVTLTASRDGSAIGSTTLTITNVSQDATLSGLSLSGIDIGEFSAVTTAYSANVPHDVASTTVTATAAHPAATVAIQPAPGVSLAEGPNEITVTVTAEDGTTTRAYTVTVTRAGLPVATIAAGATPVTEGTPAEFTLSLDAAAPEALTVSVNVAESGSVLSGTPPSSVAFAKGATSATLSVPTAGDSVVEADGTVTATLIAGSGYSLGTDVLATVAVEDDDAATFTVTAEPQTIAEGESATLTVAISNEVTFAQDQTISLVTSGTASASDYTGLPATLTLGVGASSATALLTAAADQEEEAAETVTVTASHGGSAIGSATVTIESVSQDATLSGLSLSGIDIGAFSSTVTAYTASVAHSVTATTVTATATHSGATVSIAPGPEVPLAEGANEIAVTVTAENGTTTQTYTVMVTRSNLPVVSIAAVEDRVSEAEMGRFRISRTGPIAEPLEVPVLFASSRSRRARTLTVRFVPGQRSVTRRVQNVDDTIVEDDVTVTWTLQAGEGYAVSGERGSASLVFEENDVPEFAVTLEPGEIAEGETATLTVAITNGVRFRAAQTITLAASGTASASDYRGLPETLHLSAYGTSPRFSATARLTAVADREQEAAETLTVTASHGGSAVGSATVTIMSVARDATLSALSLSGIDIGRFSAATTAYRTSVAHSVTTTTVTATATHPGATVSIAPGPEVALAEGANEIAVTVTAEDGTTTRTYTVTVTRSSLPVVSIVAVEERVSEAEQARFRVSRTGPASEPLEVPVHFTSTRSSEVQNLTVRFARGQRSVTERVEVGDDTIVEDDLTVTWTLQAGEGYAVSEDSVSASVVFEENDVPEFAVTLEPGEIAEGETATLTVAITNGVRFRAAQTIALAASGTATESDYRGLPETLRLSAYGTSATFSATARLRAVADREEEAAETLTVTASHGGSVIGSATVTITSVSRDATLSGLSLSGVDIGRFSAATTAYRASVAQSVTATTVTATASHSGATVAIEPGAEVALAEGANEITVRVTAEDGTTTRTYTVTVTRAGSSLTAQFLQLPAAHDGQAAFTFELRFSREPSISFRTLRDTAFEVTGGTVRKAKRVVSGSNLRWAITVEPSSEADVVLTLPVTADCAAVGAICTAGGSKLAQAVSATVRGPQVEQAGFPLARANSRPSGIWSDGETVWVADLEDAKLYAYGRADGEREPGKDMATEPGPMGLWSDGETLWVAGLEGGLRAHRLADGARLAERDLALEGEEAPAGVWSDGETVWAAGWLGDRVRAYRLADGERLASRDIPLKGENLMPVGLWSDGETLWVADWRERLYAYRLGDGRRVPQRDVEVSGTDADPTGLWSGGGTLLWTGWEGREVRAYRLPATGAGLAAEQARGHAGAPGGLPVIADPALGAAIRAALGKAPGETVSAGELAGLESLSARNFGVRDLAGLEAATGLKELDLGFNPLADLRPLALLPALESLNLDGAALDLRPLAALAGLRRLSVRHNLLDDLQPLGALAGLTELDIGDNRIEDLRPLAGLPRLAVLRADRNGIADLWSLASLTDLEVLELGTNEVRDLRPLAGLDRLRMLRLDRNRLAELHPLSGLRGLVDLGLAGNAIGSLGPIAGLDGLRRLDLRGSAVRDLRPLRSLASLVLVHVGGSRIEDLGPLDGLDGLTVAGQDDLAPPSVGDGVLQRSGPLTHERKPTPD